MTLVLAREPDQSVVLTVPPSDVPTVVTVKLVSVKGRKCRIGFDCPRQVQILRDDAVVREPREAPVPAVVPLPAGVYRENGGTPCDVAVGPCSCGAWHDAGEDRGHDGALA